MLKNVRMKNTVNALVKLLGGALVLLLAGEIAVRAVGFYHDAFLIPDPELGFVLSPGMKGWNREEARAFVKINSAGMRDRERAIGKLSGVIRVAVLGDSYTAALQVESDKTFLSHMERAFNADMKRVEILNFGVPGYATDQELLMLRKRVWRYSPDVVLLAFYVNDVVGNSRALNGPAMKPYFSLKEGELILDRSFREELAYRIKAGAVGKLFYSARKYLRVIGLWYTLRKSVRGEAIPTVNLEIFFEQTSDRWVEAWDITRAPTSQHE